MAQMAGRGFGGPGSPQMVVVVTSVAAADVPDYPPPFMPRMAKVDPDGRIWIPERGSAGLRPSSLIYDIIDRNGQIVDRVQVPAPYVVVAVGRGGSVYLAAPTQSSVLPGVLGSTFMTNMPMQPTMKFVRAVLPKQTVIP
jgi:hypothetical protein